MGEAVSESRQYFLGIAGEQTGPYSEDDVLAKIRAQEVPADALVWYEGLPDWQAVSTLEPFRVAFADADADAAALPADSLSAAAAMAAPLDTGLEDPPLIAEATSAPTAVATLAEPDAAGAEEAAPAPVKAKAKAKRRTRPSKDGEEGGQSPADAIASFAAGDSALEPAFKEEPEPVARKRKLPNVSFKMNRRASFLLLGFLFAAVALGVVVFVLPEGGISLPFLGGEEAAEEAVEKPANVGKAKEKLADVKKASNAAVDEQRQSDYRKAQSELLLNPEASIATLRKIIAANATDKTGRDSIDAVVTYYKQTQRPSDAGRLLMEAKRPEEAAKFFLADPPSYTEADAALFAGYQASKETARRDLLLKDIEILLGVLSKADVAVERIKILETDFPGSAHPYGYYLKSTDEKVVDLFSRLSFHFVQSLLNHLGTEFPQLGLTARPIVEVAKEKDGNYRLVGRYKGEVLLNRDRLENIVFVFWNVNDGWVLVDTNLTPERTRYAAVERNRQKGKAMNGAALLDYLQTIFRLKFPKAGFHETVSEKQANSAKDDVE